MTLKGSKLTMTRQPEIITEIGLLIYPDCQLAAIYGLTDLFRIAGEWSFEGTRAIRVSHWQASERTIDCVWDSHPGTPHKIAYTIAPPSLVMPSKMNPSPVSAKWLLDRHAEGAVLCSVCAGAFILAETGLMDGRRATTHWAFAEQLAKRFPRVHLAEAHMVVDEGDIVTAGGILAWADLGLTLVEKFLGPANMLATARFLLIGPPRTSQQPFAQFTPRFDHGDDEIRRAQHHMHAHAHETQTLSELHALVGMTERTFLRRFVAATGHRPNDYLQQIRIAKARELLEQTLIPADQIAWQIGYSDPAAFRKTFRKIVGTTPVNYRQRFGTGEKRIPALDAP